MSVPFTNAKLVNGAATVNNGAAAATLLAAPAAGKKIRVNKVMLTVETVATGGGGVVQLKDGASGTVLWQADGDALGHFPLDFGDEGYPLVDGNLLQLVVASAVTTQATVFAMATGYIVG